MNNQYDNDDRNVSGRDTNPDPITGAPGSHPVGTGVGAAGGAATGAAIGGIGGPVGMAVGGVIGAVVGGLAGKGVAEQIDPTVEEAYWKDQFRSEPYFAADQGHTYDDYGPAYRHGWDNYDRNRSFEESEPELSERWEHAKDKSRLTWDKARGAVRASWDRVGDKFASRK